MRPPQNAGESATDSEHGRHATPSFNEAPAERGGKSRGVCVACAERGRFNEAPAERGGKYRTQLAAEVGPLRLQ